MVFSLSAEDHVACLWTPGLGRRLDPDLCRDIFGRGSDRVFMQVAYEAVIPDSHVAAFF